MTLEPAQSKRSFTLRAFIVGILLSVLVVLMAQYSVNVIHGSYLAIDHMPAGGIFLFFLLVLVVSTLIRAIKRSLDFDSSELIIVYTMMLVTSSITTMGFGSQILPIISGPIYYATPENRWADIIHPHLNPSFVPQDKEAIRWLFEGLPAGESIPWSAWARPMALWIPFIVTLYFVMICIMVILRKQWVQMERLVYPLCQLPLEMVKQEDRLLIRPFFRNKLVWIGFAIPFCIGSLNALHHYFHLVPQINLVHSVAIFRRTAYLQIRLSFPIIGFAYFINLKVAFGLWFFNVLATILRSVFAITGLASTENMGPYGAWSPIFKHLGIGAMATFVSYGLWTARFHLANVLKAAFTSRKNGAVGDSDEIISYRTAVWGTIAGIVFMACWLWRSGLPLHIAFLFLFLALMIFIGLARVVAEGGLPTLITPSIAPSQIVSSLGCAAIGPAGLTTLGFTYIWCADVRTFVMSSAAHGLRLTEEIKGARRAVFWAMMLAVFIGVVGSIFVVMTLAYKYGGANMNSWYFVGNAQVAFRYVSQKLTQPTGPDGLGWMCKGIGAALMALLMFAHRSILWWPLHPMGFVIGANGWMNMLWFSIFLSWLIKSLFIGFGGPNLFRAARPFFLGLVLGQYTCAGVWFVIDSLTGTSQNIVFWI